MNLTTEQNEIISSLGTLLEAYRMDSSSHRALVVDAGAGTGKTSTVLFLAKAYPEEQFRMVCFARANADELNDKAKAEGVTNLRAVTTHKLAYEWFIDNGKKVDLIGTLLDMNYLKDTFVYPLGLSEDRATGLAWESISLLNAFFNSPCVSFEEFSATEALHATPKALEVCANYLQVAADPTSNAFITLNGMLKLYQQKGVQAFHKTDIIVVEEYQDVNPVQASWVVSQQNFLFFIGDKFQAIYSWRRGGTLIAMASEQEWPTLQLTTSFRVNPASAELANLVLSSLGGPHIVAASTKKSITSQAYLFRTNSEAVALSFALMEQKVKHRLNLDLKSLWDDFWWLSDRLNSRLLKKSKSAFRNLKTRDDVYKAADNMPEVKSMLKLLGLFSAKGGLYAVQKKVTAFQELSKNAPVIVSTAHKAKGLEWDKVILGEDILTSIMRKLEQLEDLNNAEAKEEYEEELRLLYVALTRAKVVTELPSELKEFLYLL